MRYRGSGTLQSAPFLTLSRVCTYVCMKVGLSSQRLVLQKRSAHKDTHPNRWDVSAAGHITGTDSSLETARREVFFIFFFHLHICTYTSCLASSISMCACTYITVHELKNSPTNSSLELGLVRPSPLRSHGTVAVLRSAILADLHTQVCACMASEIPGCMPL